MPLCRSRAYRELFCYLKCLSRHMYYGSDWLSAQPLLRSPIMQNRLDWLPVQSLMQRSTILKAVLICIPLFTRVQAYPLCKTGQHPLCSGLCTRSAAHMHPLCSGSREIGLTPASPSSAPRVSTLHVYFEYGVSCLHVLIRLYMCILF